MEITTSDACGCGAPCGDVATPPRPDLIRRALGLEYLTVGWNVLEGLVAVTAALIAGSVALLGFGIDSFVECASAFVMIWRLRAERDGLTSIAALDEVEHRARKLVAGSLFLLAGYVAFDALRTLYEQEHPSFSVVGVALLAVSVAVMLWLARAKREVARALGSEAMEADAFQTTACWWLSLAALVGIGVNGLLGWWWADPVAALVIAVLVAREGHASWQGRACC